MWPRLHLRTGVRLPIHIRSALPMAVRAGLAMLEWADRLERERPAQAETRAATSAPRIAVTRVIMVAEPAVRSRACQRRIVAPPLR
jgi:hypothetical protein